MRHLLLYTILFAASVTIAIASEPSTPQFGIFSGIAIGFAVPLVDRAISKTIYYKLAWYTLRCLKQNVRVSISYLYKIEVDGDYLLIKGHRFDQYQPVGGVYKYHPSAIGTFQRHGILNDQLLQPDLVSESDLRIRVPARHLTALIKWFQQARGRETDGWREFYEELLQSGILPREAFNFVQYDHIQRYYHPLRYSNWAQSPELLIADVFKLLPTPEQLEVLRSLKSQNDPRVMWATEDQIRRRGATRGDSTHSTRIAETAEWTIDA